MIEKGKEEIKAPVEIIEEDSLEFLGRYQKSIMGGTKRISIRLGRRKFKKSIKVNGYWATVNNQYNNTLRNIPFGIFQNEGWNTVTQMLQGLGSVYKGIDLNTMVTIVEFHLEIPHRRFDE